MRFLAAVSLSAVATFTWSIAAAVAAAPASTSLLSKEDSARLALYEAASEPFVVVAAAARPGRNAALVAAVQHHGGRVDYRADAIDYLDAVLPLRNVRGLLSEPSLQVLAIDHLQKGGRGDESLPMLQTNRDPALTGIGRLAPQVQGFSAEWPPKLPARPLEQTYPILRDMDGEAFRARDVRFDGRGVVIAHVEGFPDFLLPELQLALDSTGRPVPKILDVINVRGPVPSLDVDAGPRGRTWVELSRPLVSRERKLSFEDKVYRVPRPGRYRVGLFEVSQGEHWGRHLSSIVRKRGAADVESNTHEPQPFSIAVLWSESDRTAWLDENGNRDFSDDAAVHEYRVSQKFGILGRDDPATAVRETIAYALQIDGNYLSINLGVEEHATFVAGAAAASKGKRGRIEGIAPGAQIISIAAHSNESIAGYARALVAGFTDQRVDVVLIQGHGLITEGHHPKDGRSLLAIVLSRLVDRYRKPALATAMNMPSMSAVSDQTIPDNVLSVGASQSSASVFAYYGIRTRYPQDLHWAGAEGPAGNGVLKPDFLAPANPVTLDVRFRAHPELSRYPGIFELPPGYMIGGGTSVATPVAAGAAALLVGAAKLHGLPHDADTINLALRNSASFIPDFPAYKQGRGVIRLDAAWMYLNRGEERYEIEIAAPVRTVWSHTLAQPHTGAGLFERDGWRKGDSKERTIRLIRKDGPDESLVFDVRWQGNHQAFSTASRVELPLNKPVQLPMRINPTSFGVHSALLHLHHAEQSRAAATLPVTIVVPKDFAPHNGHTWHGDVMLDRPGRYNVFFRVPEGTDAFTVGFVSARKSVQLRLFSPAQPSHMHFISRDGDRAQLTIEAPMAGVWEAMLHDIGDEREFDWNLRDTECLPQTSVKMWASVGGASVEIDGNELVVENRFAGFKGGVLSTALGGMRAQTSHVVLGGTRAFDIEVEEGQELLVAEITRLSGGNLDLDLHLFDCTSGRCGLASKSSTLEAHERVLVKDPAPGKWKVVVVATGVGTEEVTFSLNDYYIHRHLGALSTTDTRQWRATGTRWRVPFNLWHVAGPRPGYEAIGVLQVRGRVPRVPISSDYQEAWDVDAGRWPLLGLGYFAVDSLKDARD